MSAPAASGHIEVRNDAVVYAMPDAEVWQVAIADLRVIGEYTTMDGPFGDDYFFIFLTPERRFEASFYASGRDTALTELGARLSHEFHLDLCFFTSLASRVLRPAKLGGLPLFDLVPVKPASFFGRLRQRIFSRVNLHLTEEVLAESQ